MDAAVAAASAPKRHEAQDWQTDRFLKVYLPAGLWYDFSSNRHLSGRQTMMRYMNLSTYE